MIDYPQLLNIYARVEAIKARIEGMKAHNLERLNHGYALAYSDQAFGEMADDLEKLANEALPK